MKSFEDRVHIPYTLAYSLYTSVVSGLEKCLVKDVKNVTKRIISGFWKKAHAYLQTILKAPVKFQKDQSKTEGGVTSVVLGL